jgi:peptide deformylase
MLTLLKRSGFFKSLKNGVKVLPIANIEDPLLRTRSHEISNMIHQPTFTTDMIKLSKKKNSKGIIGRPELLDAATLEIIRRDIHKFLTQEQIEFIYNMYHTMSVNTENLQGLSSVQVGIPQKIFVTMDKVYELPVSTVVESSNGKHKKVVHGIAQVASDLELCINPRVLDVSSEQERDVEGCASAPGVYVIISRPKQVEVEYTNICGQRIRKIYEGMPARVFLHEMDHQEGILYFDRVKEESDKFTRETASKYIDLFGDLLPKWR